MRKAIAFASVAAFGILSLTACGGGDSDDTTSDAANGEITGKITLQTWSLTPTFQEYLDDVIAGFEAKYPGTEVTLVDQPGDGYSDKVLSQAASGTLPDVINIPPDFALPLVGQDMLLDISSVDDTLSDTYVAGSLDAYTFNGHDGVYGYPWYLNTDVNYWNSSMFTECGLDPAMPPTNEEELLQQAGVMKGACPDNYMISRKPRLGELALAGVPILSEDGTEFVFNTPAAAAVIDQYVFAYANGYMPPDVLNNDYLGNSTLFTKAQVAWTTGGGSAISDFVRDNPSLEGNVVVSRAFGGTSPLYVQGLSVAKTSKNQATAVAFAQWITNAENQNAFAHIVNVFPSTLASASDPYFTESDGSPEQDAKVLAYESLATAMVLQPYEVNSAMDDIVSQQIALAIKGDITSQEALDASAEKLNELLERQ